MTADWDPDSYAALIPPEKSRRKPKDTTVPTIGCALTDIGNAERFSAKWRGRVRYCYGRDRWLVWDGRRWAWDAGGEITRFAIETVRSIYSEGARAATADERSKISEWAVKSESASALANMLRVAKDMPGIGVQLVELDSNPLLLNCENGTIDLATGKLLAHDASDLITKLCPCEFHSSAKHPTWEKFITGATQGDAELAAYIQRAAGYGLQGNASERALFFVYGPPGSAKSTLIDALGAAIGDYHVASGRETWLVQKNPGGNRGDLVRLAGARLVTATEFRRGDKFDEGLIKQVTGGDAITAAAKYEGEVTFRPTFTLFFAANAAPVIRDDDAGMWVRMRRIPFDHAIPEAEQDKSIKQTLQLDPAARAAVLAWAVQGCLNWGTQGIGQAKAVTKSNEAYRAEMDPIGEFFKLCKFGKEEQITAGAFRKAYKTWCEDNGIRYQLERRDIEERLKPYGARYATIRGKQWVKGIDMLGDYEDPQPSLYPEWNEKEG